jgi:hypothetical protein
MLKRGAASARRWFAVLIVFAVCEAVLFSAGWYGLPTPYSLLKVSELCTSIAAIALLASALLGPANHAGTGPSNNALQLTSGAARMNAARS